MEGAAVDERSGDEFVWSSPEWGRSIAMGKKIFCNRPLNMKNIVAVGFDMDYTLAQYMPETFESLAYDGTVRKLVYKLGYPPEVCVLEQEPCYSVRRVGAMFLCVVLRYMLLIFLVLFS